MLHSVELLICVACNIAIFIEFRIGLLRDKINNKCHIWPDVHAHVLLNRNPSCLHRQSLLDLTFNPSWKDHIILAGASVMTTLDLSWLTSLACILCNMLCTSRSRITPRSPQSNTCLLLYKDEQCAHNNCWHHTYCVDVNICCHISTFAFLAASQGRQCGWTADWALSHAT